MNLEQRMARFVPSLSSGSLLFMPGEQNRAYRRTFGSTRFRHYWKHRKLEDGRVLHATKGFRSGGSPHRGKP